MKKLLLSTPPNVSRALVIDGYNMLHRARSGFKLGDHPVVFNFFKSFRSVVERFAPTRVYFVLEGHPKRRHELYPEYKANRKIDPDDAAKIEEMRRFEVQKDEIVRLLDNFPVSKVRHPDHECDDVVYNMIKNSTSCVSWTVVSTDSDFIQLLEEFANVKVYNPTNKTFVEVDTSICSYVHWKALRGDPSDNIRGIHGVGDKTAIQLLNDEEKLRALLEVDDNAAIYRRNQELIKFERMSIEDMMRFESSVPTRDWGSVRKTFDDMKFRSITNDDAWKKFVDTFEGLWGN